MQGNSDSETSEMYNINMTTFENGKPEEILTLLNNSKIAIDGTGTTSATGRIEYLRTMLRGEGLREFNELANWNTCTKIPT